MSLAYIRYSGQSTLDYSRVQRASFSLESLSTIIPSHHRRSLGILRRLFIWTYNFNALLSSGIIFHLLVPPRRVCPIPNFIHWFSEIFSQSLSGPCHTAPYIINGRVFDYVTTKSLQIRHPNIKKSRRNVVVVHEARRQTKWRQTTR